jgi:hypothetical protein
MNHFVCKQCGQGFEQRAPYDQHMAGTHAPRTLSAADLEKALAPVDFPMTKGDLLEYASRQVTMDATIVEALESVPERTYRSAAEVAAAFLACAPNAREPKPRQEAVHRAS